MTDQSSKVVSRGECTACGSSDANVLYEDNSKYCFSCQTYTKGDKMEAQPQQAPIQGVYKQHFTDGATTAIPDRGIKEETCKFYGVKTIWSSNNDIIKHIYPYHDKETHHVANKIREVKNKGFFVEGRLPDATLFGANRFKSGGKYITVCEGEIDAMSAFEMLGSKWPVVSIKNGAQSALKDIKANYEYLNGFDNIVLCFDSDEHGKKAASQVAQVFEPNKCLIMDMEMKDANEYIKQNKREQFSRSWWNAKPFTPAGIIRLCDHIDELFEEDEQDTVLYPYSGLNDKLYGMRTGELVTITAGTGAGKTSMMYELEYHILKNIDSNIGIIHLEENKKQTMFHLMSIPANKRLFIKEVRKDMTRQDMEPFIQDTVQNPKLIAFNHFGSITTDEILAKVRYMVKAMDCKFVVIDHLSILVSGLDDGDERRNIDMLMTKLRSLVEETQCGLLLVSHLRRMSGDKGQEQGGAISLSQLRGSHSIAQLSDAVIALERNQQADDPVEANTTTVRVLKNRYAGDTGIACYLHYDKDTGRLAEIENPFEADNGSTEDIGDFL